MSGKKTEAVQPTLLHRLGEMGATLGRQGPRRRSTKLALQIGIPALVFAALCYVVLRQWHQLPSYHWHFSFVWLALAVFGLLLFSVLSAAMWQTVVRLMGERLGFIPAQAIFGKSLLARYVPGNMLMVVGRVVMAEREGISRKASLTSVVYELGLQFCAAVVTASYFIVTLSSLQHTSVRWLVLAAIPLILVLLHPRVFRLLADKTLHKLGREPLPTALNYSSVLALLVGYILLWGVMGAASYAFIRSVYPLDSSNIPFVAASYAFAWCIAVVTFIAPSGLGTRDVAYTLALKTVLPAPVAIAIAVGARILQIVVELLYVAIAVTADRARREL